jgi:hypothetical protein
MIAFLLRSQAYQPLVALPKGFLLSAICNTQCMKRNILSLVVLLGTAAYSQSISLRSTVDMKQHNVKAEPVTYKGHAALKVTAPEEANEDRLVVLTKTDFKDGTIEVELTGEPGPGAAATARGFVGVAFRVAADVSAFECFYLRPTNGRADDQVRRNHSLQYISFPSAPWQKLRQEFPGKYESYADIVPADWNKVRIKVAGAKAKLYVNGAVQPSLIVNDLKLGDARGAIGLWIGPGTVAHFSNLRISK